MMTEKELREALEKLGIHISEKNFDKIRNENALIEELMDLGYFDYEKGDKALDYLIRVQSMRILGMKE